MRIQLLIPLFVFALFLSACAGGASPAPVETVAPVKITVQTTPEPPVTGEVELIFTVVDKNGQPVSGADFDVIADHTDMSGMTMHGKATDQGNGKYAITTNFSMPGNWKLAVQVRNGVLNYTQDINLVIE